MGLMNKRNALLGWTVWQFGKRMAKKKVKAAVPGRVDDSKKPNKSAIATGLAAVGGALWFWRRRRGDSDES
ncbi:MAG: LPXTG cell wall anchor domain-containing protein [Actinomycetota bacterium]